MAEARAQAQAQATEADQLRKELQRVNALLSQRAPLPSQPEMQPASSAEAAGTTQPPSVLPPDATERARAGSATGSTDAGVSGSTSARSAAPPPAALPVASPRNVAAAKAYAAALAAEGHPVSAASLLAGAAARAATEPSAKAVAANPPPAAAPAADKGVERLERRGSDGTGDDAAAEAATTGAESGVPVCPPGVTQRLYTTILHMSVSALKGMLTRAGIPHGDCREKNDLRERLLQAVEKGQSLSPTTGPRPGHSFAAGPGAAAGAPREQRGPPTSEYGEPSGSSSRRPSSGPASGDVPFDARLHAAGTARPTGSGDAATFARGEHSASTDGAPASGAPGPAEVAVTNTASPPQNRPPLAMATSGLPEAAKAPSPQELKNWLPARAPDGAVYYYHRVSRAVRWDKPEAEIARKMEARILGVRAEPCGDVIHFA